jgi:hypothetical protein
MQVRWKAAVLSAVAAGGLVGLSLLPQQASAAPQPMRYDDLTKTQKRLLSGFASAEVDQARGTLAPKTARTAPKRYAPSSGPSGNFYVPSGSRGCAYTLGGDVNMDTDCQNISDADLAGRGQAQNETYISQDHNRPGNLLGSSNDYRRGDGGCFGYYSLDNGRSFQDVAIPFGFTRGAAYGAARQYWSGGGDTSSAFDTHGNAYYSCQVFNRGRPTSSNPDLSSALLVFRSTGNGGASYTFPARVVTEQPLVSGTAALPFLDKQLLSVDNHVRSPFRDRVYVTWTTFAPDGSAYIYESHSADYAETWSAPVRVSAANPGLCKLDSDKGGDPDAGGGGNAADEPAPAPGQCYANQFSQPFTGPDGALYVVWANFNNAVTGGDNRNQILIAKSTDGGTTFSAPAKATDYYDLPDCYTYTGQNLGRGCVPDKGDNVSFFRAVNYPVGAVDPTNSKHVVVTVGSYINAYSKESNGCTPTGLSSTTGANLFTGVRSPGACNNGIIVSESKDGGATFNGRSTDPRNMPLVTQARGQRTTDQWFQWADYTRDGRLAVSYYDRQYGNDELTGASDFSLSGSRDIRRFAGVRVTSSSMPAPTQFSGTFWGDYTGLAAWTGVAHPSWSDTRTPGVFTCPGSATTTTPPSLCVGTGPHRANDQEAMTDSVRVPTP